MKPAREMRPRGAGWREADRFSPTGGGVLAVSWWTDGELLVCSALEHAEYPDRSGSGPQWHVSISRLLRCGHAEHPSRVHIRRVLRAFEMIGAEEDNHHPGVARHFWRPVDAAHRVDCECKATEDTVVEPDGYRWTNPKPGEGPCRGCALQALTGAPCPIHAARAQEPLR